MTDNELIYVIWGIKPLNKQFEVAPYSLTLDDMKLLKKQSISKFKRSEGLYRKRLAPTSLLD